MLETLLLLGRFPPAVTNNGVVGDELTEAGYSNSGLTMQTGQGAPEPLQTQPHYRLAPFPVWVTH